MNTDSVYEGENISRFLNSDGVSKQSGLVKPSAYQPPAKNKKLSVYRTSDLSEDQIWHIGYEFVEKRSKRHNPKIVGRGDILAKEVVKTGLTIEPMPDPHEPHMARGEF